MKKVLFCIQNALQRLYALRRINIIIVITISIGLLIPLAILTIVNNTFENIQMSRDEVTDQTVIIEFAGKFLTEENMSKKLERFIPDMEEMGFCVMYMTSGTIQNKDCVISLASYSSEYLNLVQYKVEEGHMLTEEEIENNIEVCNLQWGYTGYEGQGELNIPITVMGHQLKPVGVIRHKAVYGSVIVGYPLLEKMIGDKANLQYYIIVKSANMPSIAQLTTKFSSDPSISELQVLSAKDYYKVRSDAAIRDFSKKLGFASLALGFSVIGFVMIMYGKICDEQYMIALKLGIGASKKDIFFEILIQIVCIVVLAYLIDFSILPYVMKGMSIGVAYLIDLRVIAIAAIFGAFLSLGVSGFLVMRIMQFQVSEIRRSAK